MVDLAKWYKEFRKRGLPLIFLLDVRNKTMELVDPEDVEYISNNVVEIYGRGLYFDFGDIVFIEGYPAKIFISGYPEAQFLEFLRPAQLEKVKEELERRRAELEQYLNNLAALVEAGILDEKELRGVREEYAKITELLQHFNEAIRGATLAERQLQALLEKIDTLSPQFYLQALYSRIGRYINFNELWQQVGALSNKVFLGLVVVGVLFLLGMYIVMNYALAPALHQLATSMHQLANALQHVNATNTTHSHIIVLGKR